MSNASDTNTDMTCDWCSRPIEPTPYAPGKRFCSRDCRQKWHNKRREDAMTLLRQQEQERK
jgi:predicted nucleic acid-binding Zn ribbon protein